MTPTDDAKMSNVEPKDSEDLIASEESEGRVDGLDAFEPPVGSEPHGSDEGAQALVDSEDSEEDAEAEMLAEPHSDTADEDLVVDEAPEDNVPTSEELIFSVEAILFAAAEPMTLAEVRRVFERAVARSINEDERLLLFERLRDAWGMLRKKWKAFDGDHGFGLKSVAGALTFRSDDRFASLILNLREQRPPRLSKAALETLAIIAYRQPCTKPDADQIRGVDCGGTIRLLLDRNLIRIVGKSEEVGRPMLYGTTRDFLSFFNLNGINDLPSLSEFSELNAEMEAELSAFDEANPQLTLKDLSEGAQKLKSRSEEEVEQLEAAVSSLDTQEQQTAEVFREQGIELQSDVRKEKSTPTQKS